MVVHTAMLHWEHRIRDEAEPKALADKEPAELCVHAWFSLAVTVAAICRTPGGPMPSCGRAAVRSCSTAQHGTLPSAVRLGRGNCVRCHLCQYADPNPSL